MLIGLPAYLAELGLAGPAVPSRADVGSPGPAAPTAARAATGSSAVGASLLELESLRAAGLIADDEYAAKRREILARL